MAAAVTVEGLPASLEIGNAPAGQSQLSKLEARHLTVKALQTQAHPCTIPKAGSQYMQRR